MDSFIADPSLAARGLERAGWARANMPLLAALRDDFSRERPLAGRRLGMCLHVEPKTAVLVEVLLAGGCDLALTGSPATTDDGTAAALAALDGVTVFAANADDASAHAAHLERVLAFRPDLLLDNGAELIAAAAARGLGVTAATEETTSGANRLKAELHGRVPFPVVVIDDSPLKRLIENTYGVGPTVVEGFMRATNLLVAATVFCVVGYGACGRGVARALRADGATVLVVERDPVRALEAAFDGMTVRGLDAALSQADAVITVTGTTGVIGRRELGLVRDGVLLANAGHFSEIELEQLGEGVRAADAVTEHVVDGRRIRLLGRGEMLNLTAATGNQIQVMDLGFALQARSLRALAADPSGFAAGPQPVPAEIDDAVARGMLAALSTA
ncbi:MAG TPA: adenosylhomocysteinase [Gaiellaceae bacterium]|nr:adenosylhomocysteinase [Gaiellaceae bacterium]